VILISISNEPCSAAVAATLDDDVRIVVDRKSRSLPAPRGYGGRRVQGPDTGV